MLDLNTRVHFHEIKVAGIIDQKLHRAGILITDRLRQFHAGVSHFFAQSLGHERRRTFLNHFLVAPLDGAIAFTQVHDVTVFVRHDLKFDVMRIDDQFLDVNVAVPKSLLCFHARGMKGWEK